MSGHSHWSSIKHKKGRADEKRSKDFAKLSKIIEVAARNGGGPDLNPKLAIAIEKARGFNMPADNIERAIKKGTGQTEAEKLEELTYEGYGPAGIAIIIEAITDNKNRTVSELKHIFSQFEGKLAETGAVKWMFERKGVISLNLEQEIFKNLADEQKREKLELIAIEVGADNINWFENKLDIFVNIDNIKKVRDDLIKNSLVIEGISLDWIPANPQDVADEDKAKIEKFFEALDENDSVQEIYSNLR
ncbi:MAG: YebC/PmpR family DNA-binding transcriptional regulator [bacterium]|nr:YebC/PmpR family DNA-binding transcriptional regulator [bacterium]